MIMNVTEQKKLLRKQIKQYKLNHSIFEIKEKSKVVFSKLEKLKEFENASIIMIYWAMADEVQTQDFIEKWEASKTFLLPVVHGDDMVIKKFENSRQLVEGEKYGIEEPIGEEFEDYSAIDMIIVPGIAFGKNLSRLGRGKAYYDKFLKTLNAFKIGICFDFQLFDSVPADENDVRMDLVISN